MHINSILTELTFCYASTVSLNLCNVIILAFTALILLATAIIYWRGTKQAIRKSTWEATHKIYEEWWGEDLNRLRKYFYREFLQIYMPKYENQLNGKGMKELDKIIIEDKGRIRLLCYFFDRIGWLGAAKLIDIDYVLGPMQHCLRRVWIVMRPFIQRERQSSPDHLLDPVYQFGFEWLFERSNKKQLASLVRKKFRNPKLLKREQSKELQEQIDKDENNFNTNFSQESIVASSNGK